MPDIISTIHLQIRYPVAPPTPTRPGLYFRPWPHAPYYPVGWVEYLWRRLWLREGQSLLAVQP